MRTFALFCLPLFVAPCAARADLFAGNPVADGWANVGNSLANGSYIRGAGNFSFDIFRTGFTVGASGPLTSMANPWSAGDRVVGLGGVIVPASPATVAGWSSFPSVVNAQLTSSTRIVAKFGTTPTAWSASSLPPGAGNGLGSTSQGNGGLGTILLTSVDGALTNPAGILRPTDFASQYQTFGSDGPQIDPNIGRYVYQLDGSGLLKSWEVLLDVTRLNALGLGFPLPNDSDRFNAALQRGTSATLFTDGLVPALDAPPNTVPAPPAAILALLAGAVIGLRRRMLAA